MRIARTKFAGVGGSWNSRHRRFLMTLLITLATTTCSSSDQDVARHLRVEFAAENGGMYPGRVSFGVRCSAHGQRIYFSGRKLIVTANGKAIAMPDWTGPLEGHINPIGRQIRYWHMSSAEVERCLGEPGTYSLEASIGPVKSAPIRITVPGLVIESSSLDHIQRSDLP